MAEQLGEERAIAFEGVQNVRDLGGIPTANGGAVARGLFFRGAALHSLTEADVAKMRDGLGVACVIDLRCGWEVEAKPNVALPGVELLHIPFYDKEKVGIDYTEAADGTKVVGRDIACEPEHFYRSLANPLTVGQMRKGLAEVFARAERGQATYQHCSGGKDRTGIMAFLLLSVLGAEPDAILEDYLLTNVWRDATIEHVYERFLRLASGDEARARELTESHRARPENIEVFLRAIDEAFGSFERFLRDEAGLGISAERQAKLQAKFTG